MSEFQVKVSNRTPVEYVLKNGTESQKAVIKMFDWDSNGVIDRKEARGYNKYSIEDRLKQNNDVLLMRKSGKEAYVFNYDKLSDLENFAIWKGGLYLRAEGEHLQAENIQYDADANTLTIANGKDVQVKHLDVEN